MRYLLVQYTGKLEPRYDNVMPRSNRVWETTGSVLRIPEEEAYVYLTYPESFKLVSAEVVAHEMVEKVNSTPDMELMKGLVGMLSKENLVVLAKHLQECLDAPEEEVEPLKVDYLDPESVKRYGQRMATIIHTIRSLPENRDNFAASGEPVLNVVRRESRIKDVSRREIRSAVAVIARTA